MVTVSFTVVALAQGGAWLRSLRRSPLEEQRLIRPQHQVLAHHHPHRKARPDRQRRLDAHVALRDLLPDLVHCLLALSRPATTIRLPSVRLSGAASSAPIPNSVDSAASTDSGPNANRRHPRARRSRQGRCPADGPMRGRRVRQDQPRPHQQHATLTEGNLAVVAVDQARALGISRCRPVAVS